MGFIAWIILGALAGWIASMIMRTNAEQGAIANIIVGILGAVIGGFLMQMFGASGVEGFSLYSLLVAIGGAVALLAVYKAVTNRA
ncbi:MAG: GlsB/YeaQ/YmgE family stress response membrane protein [bacterium]|nr:GlsB/YeaQ/YmgE family stress response membrane protein [bacterium]